MKKVIIAIPEGYKYLEISIPEEFVPFLHTRAIKDLDSGSSYSHIVLDEAPTKRDKTTEV